MMFEINTQFKLAEKNFPDTVIKTDEFFGIGKNPLDDYDAILLNPKAEREKRPIVDLTSLQGNSYKVDLPGAEESDEQTAIYIHVEDAASGRISITNHDLYSLFHYYQRSRERKRETSTRCITGYWKNTSTVFCRSRQENSGRQWAERSRVLTKRDSGHAAFGQ